MTLDDSGEAKASFTVTNTTTHALRGHLVTRPREPASPDWLSVAGEPVRDFGPGGAERVVAQLKIPPGSTPGSYSFRLDAISEADPDEDFTEGPSVAFQVLETTEEKKRFPWWIVILAAAVALLIAVGIVVWLFVRDDGTAAVPGVVGRPSGAAQTMLQDAGFGVKAVRVGVNDTTRRDVVQTQDPAAGTRLPKQTEVTINVGYMALVPNVLGAPEARAISDLGRAELSADTTPGVIQDERQFGMVQSQDPTAGTYRQPGTAVTIVVGRNVLVPKVVGLRDDAASFLLVRAGLTPDVTTQNTFDRNEHRMVLSQSPGQGDVKPFRSKVDLVVGQCIGFC